MKWLVWCWRVRSMPVFLGWLVNTWEPEVHPQSPRICSWQSYKNNDIERDNEATRLLSWIILKPTITHCIYTRACHQMYRMSGDEMMRRHWCNLQVMPEWPVQDSQEHGQNIHNWYTQCFHLGWVHGYITHLLGPERTTFVVLTTICEGLPPK